MRINKSLCPAHYAHPASPLNMSCLTQDWSGAAHSGPPGISGLEDTDTPKNPERIYREDSLPICPVSGMIINSGEGPLVLFLIIIHFAPHFNDALHNEP